jgi:hypothetical protein
MIKQTGQTKLSNSGQKWSNRIVKISGKQLVEQSGKTQIGQNKYQKEWSKRVVQTELSKRVAQQTHRTKLSNGVAKQSGRTEWSNKAVKQSGHTQRSASTLSE